MAFIFQNDYDPSLLLSIRCKYGILFILAVTLPSRPHSKFMYKLTMQSWLHKKHRNLLQHPKKYSKLHISDFQPRQKEWFFTSAHVYVIVTRFNGCSRLTYLEQDSLRRNYILQLQIFTRFGAERKFQEKENANWRYIPQVRSTNTENECSF